MGLTYNPLLPSDRTMYALFEFTCNKATIGYETVFGNWELYHSTATTTALQKSIYLNGNLVANNTWTTNGVNVGDIVTVVYISSATSGYFTFGSTVQTQGICYTNTVSTSLYPNVGTTWTLSNMTDIRLFLYGSTASNYFFAAFNKGSISGTNYKYGAISKIYSGLFDTSYILVVGSNYMAHFNYYGCLSSLPYNSFNTPLVSAISQTNFLLNFNYYGFLTMGTAPTDDLTRGVNGVPIRNVHNAAITYYYKNNTTNSSSSFATNSLIYYAVDTDTIPNTNNKFVEMEYLLTTTTPITNFGIMLNTDFETNTDRTFRCIREIFLNKSANSSTSLTFAAGDVITIRYTIPNEAYIYNSNYDTFVWYEYDSTNRNLLMDTTNMLKLSAIYSNYIGNIFFSSPSRANVVYMIGMSDISNFCFSDGTYMPNFAFFGILAYGVKAVAKGLFNTDNIIKIGHNVLRWFLISSECIGLPKGDFNFRNVTQVGQNFMLYGTTASGYLPPTSTDTPGNTELYNPTNYNISIPSYVGTTQSITTIAPGTSYLVPNVWVKSISYSISNNVSVNTTSGYFTKYFSAIYNNKKCFALITSPPTGVSVNIPINTDMNFTLHSLNNTTVGKAYQSEELSDYGTSSTGYYGLLFLGTGVTYTLKNFNLSDFYKENDTNINAGDYFMSSFNYSYSIAGLITSIPTAFTSLENCSFDTSNITTVGSYFFARFNNGGSLTALPQGSFDTSNITSIGKNFLGNFNYRGSLTALPYGSFNLTNIPISAKSYFLVDFNNGGALKQGTTPNIVPISNRDNTAITFYYRTGTSTNSSISIASGANFNYALDQTTIPRQKSIVIIGGTAVCN